MNKPFMIPAANLGKLNEKLGKLNKRAIKLGLSQITSKVTGVHIENNKRWFCVEIDGVAQAASKWARPMY